MRIFAPIAISLAVLSGVSGIQAGQSPAASSQEASCSITGRVTIENEAAPDIAVVLQQATGSFPLPPPVARATTDKEGRFKLTNVAAGRYYLTPLAAAYFSPSEDQMAPGKIVTLLKGEDLEGVELKLIPGGVITGRVTTAGGYAVIGQEIYLRMADRRSQRQLPASSDAEHRFKTDDRGVYRVYGLPAGRYVVSVWSEWLGHRTLTFHPGVNDESQAGPIEVIAGRVVENVDIKMHPIMRAYEASGRVVDEATGQPIPKIRLSGSVVGDNRSRLYLGNAHVDERGEFRFSSIIPGRYAIYVSPLGLSEYYSDQVIFDVVDQDVSGLLIKARLAASLSGKVVIEGSRDPAVQSYLPNLQVSAGKMGEAWTMIPVGADGRFRFPGLSPGKVWISVYSPSQRQRFWLLGVERDGVLQSEGIEVAAGEQVTGLRLIVAYGAGAVRGQVQVIGGTLPEGARLGVSARRIDVQGRQGLAPSVNADARGHFLLEGLATGVYEIALTAYAPSSSGLRGWPPVKQTISVTSGAESQVTLVLDVNASNVKEEKR